MTKIKQFLVIILLSISFFSIQSFNDKISKKAENPKDNKIVTLKKAPKKQHKSISPKKKAQKETCITFKKLLQVFPEGPDKELFKKNFETMPKNLQQQMLMRYSRLMKGNIQAPKVDTKSKIKYQNRLKAAENLFSTSLTLPEILQLWNKRNDVVNGVPMKDTTLFKTRIALSALQLMQYLFTVSKIAKAEVTGHQELVTPNPVIEGLIVPARIATSSLSLKECFESAKNTTSWLGRIGNGFASIVYGLDTIGNLKNSILAIKSATEYLKIDPKAVQARRQD